MIHRPLHAGGLCPVCLCVCVAFVSKRQEKQRIEYILRRNNAVKPKLISIVFLSFSSFIIIHKEQEDEYDAHSENVSSMSSQYEQGDAAATSLIV